VDLLTRKQFLNYSCNMNTVKFPYNELPFNEIFYSTDYFWEPW